MKNFDLKKIIPYVIAVIVFVVISLVYFSPVLQGKKIQQSDGVNFRGVSKEIVDYREKGDNILWTNSLFGGMPAYQISVIYQNNISRFFSKLFYLWLPMPAAILFILLLGFFILLISLKADPWLSMVGAIAFGFSTYFFLAIGAGHNTKTMAVACMPAILSGAILAFRGRYLLGGALMAIFLSIQIFVNHIQMTYYFMILFGFVILAEIIYNILKKQYLHFVKALAVIIIAFILAVLPNISQLWTSYEYMKDTIRGKPVLTSELHNKSTGLDRDYITQWSYGIGETFTLMIPNVKGGADGALNETKSALDNVDRKFRKDVAQQNHYWGNLPFTAGPVYVGAFVCFLFILGLFIVKGRLKWALLTTTILAILLSWGHNFNFLTNFFIDYIPFYSKFRAVSSILVVVEVTIPLLAILALKEIAENPKIIKEKKLFFFISLGLTAGLTLLFVLLPTTFFNFIKNTEATQFNELIKKGADSNLIDGFISNLETARVSIFKMSCLRSLLFILIGAGVLWTYSSMKKISKYVLYVAIAILIMIDMVPVDRKYLNDKNFETPKKVENPFITSTADNFILQDSTLNFRVLNLTVGNFTTDASTSYFHKSIGGYHAAKLKRYQDLIEHRIVREHDRLIKTLQSDNVTDSVLIATLYGLTSLNMLNTKYYIYSPNARPLRNPAALGNAWFVKEIKWVENPDEEIKALDHFIPATTAVVDKSFEENTAHFNGEINPISEIKLIKYHPDTLTYEAKSLKSAQLAVFSEIYYDKGWNAYIDGEKAPYFRANYLLRAMVVPAGDHKIEFRFEPKSYFTGNKISLFGSIFLLLLVFLAIFFEFKRGKQFEIKQP